MRSRYTPFGGLLAGMALALFTASAVGAYEGEVAATIVGTGPSGPQTCETAVTVTATVQDTTGKLIEGQPVNWVFDSGNIAGDSIADATTITDVNGVATTTVQFACTPRSVTLSVTADAASGTFVVEVGGETSAPVATAPPAETPAATTDTSAPPPTQDGSIPVVLIVALLALVGGAALLLAMSQRRKPVRK